MATESIRDVAAQAGVSVATVSNALINRARVTPRMRVKVQGAIADLGYLPNESARALRIGRSREICLLVADVRNPFFADLGHGRTRSVTS